jgi:hypothetical protein
MCRLVCFTGLLTALLVIGSCKPDEGLYAPEIIFMEPKAGQAIDMPDTLDVKVQISDYRLIRTAVLTLVNENKIPVIPAKYFYPDSTEFFINASLPLVDKSLASGQYNLLVTVSDGTDQKNHYQPVVLNEIPVQLEAYFVITSRLDFKSTIIKLNPSFETDTQFVFPHAYLLSAVHGMWDEFFFVTTEPSDILAFKPETFEAEWDMAASPPRPLITALFPDKDLVFSTANGDAGILDADGNISLRTQAFDNKTIQCLAADDKYIFAAHISLSGDIHELTVFSRITGDLWEQRLVSGEIKSLVPVENKLLLFMQVASNAEIVDYDPMNFILTEVAFLPGENIKSTVKISDSQVLILTEDKVISYNPASNQLSDYKDQAYKFGRYDFLNDEVFLAMDTVLYGFRRNTGVLIGEKSFQEKILDFQILYNK